MAERVAVRFRPRVDRTPEMDEGQRRCYDLLCAWAGGSSHLYNLVTDCGYGLCYSHDDELATFDFDGLTRLVLLAHERCVRVAVRSGGPRRIQITLHPRVREGDICVRHPFIEDVLLARRNEPVAAYQWPQKEVPRGK